MPELELTLITGARTVGLKQMVKWAEIKGNYVRIADLSYDFNKRSTDSHEADINFWVTNGSSEPKAAISPLSWFPHNNSA